MQTKRGLGNRAHWRQGGIFSFLEEWLSFKGHIYKEEERETFYPFPRRIKRTKVTANQWTKTSKNLSEMTSPLYLFLNQIFDRLLRDYGAMICDSVRGFGTIGGEGSKR